jgi:hypothetical protein
VHRVARCVRPQTTAGHSDSSNHCPAQLTIAPAQLTIAPLTCTAGGAAPTPSRLTCSCTSAKTSVRRLFLTGSGPSAVLALLLTGNYQCDARVCSAHKNGDETDTGTGGLPADASWTRLGFQNENPATDFRASGTLGLLA